ncbi:MAG: WGR domain-containing protein [Clostridium sp.]|uniref:WGR domain-containing protein n=1 Tax=Clostridium sp. TaxID=1506 RepID=UPI003F305216
MRNAVGLVYSSREKNSNKFYVMWSYRECVYINSGRLGDNGKLIEKKFNMRDEARDYIEKKLKEKLKKGYIKYPIEKISIHNKNDFLCDAIEFNIKKEENLND